MKKYHVIMAIVLMTLTGCATKTEFFFLNRWIVMDKNTEQLLDREFLPITVLRYRWLSPTEAVVYGMDEQQKRGCWLWDGWRKTFSSLDEDIQGFDVSGKTLLLMGSTWDNGYTLKLGKIHKKSFVSQKSILFPFIPQNSLGVDGGFYLSARDDAGLRRVFFVSLAGELQEVLVLSNTMATLRFLRVNKRPLVYTSYEKEKEPSLYAFVDNPSPKWQNFPIEGTIGQKAVSLSEAIGFVLMREGKNFWAVCDTNMQPLTTGPEWRALIFEELFDNLDKTQGVFLCLLPDEKRSTLMVFRWEENQWRWKSFAP
ncbi:hypothetical protein [Thermospira aquatica]|uniref:Lipoprotein n=1 Tax=Thermospira aquatica TaxID=2828656 RepID=A0AAX3BEW1_9SPIR|nr:hypothetical protein [Thermospira aquatica]URA10761.1 hypothetical protein KDW03_02860 [Thermospira aquatica]